MKSKKQKPVKKYVAGGALLAGALKAIPALAQGALSIGQIGLGAGELIGGLAAERKLKAPSTATPASYREMFESAQNQALVQQNIDQINRASATYLQALQSGGAQAVAAGLQPLAMGTQQAAQDVYNQQIAREQNAALNLAAADERAIRRGTDFYENRLDETRAARSGGIQNIFGGASSLGKTLVDATSGQSESQKRGKQKITDVAPMEETSFIEQVNLQPTGGMVKPMSNIPSLVDNDALLKRALEMSRFAFEDGGMVTGGKFDHNTNPIDIVKKGKKIGEMTGGEVILNPAQQKKLSKESVYFRQLLKKFNKQK
jgi:hypothetical protein